MLAPSRQSEIVAYANLQAPHRRTDVDCVVGFKAAQARRCAGHDRRSAADDIAALRVDAANTGDILDALEIAPALNVPARVEQVQEVIDRGKQLDVVVEAEEVARSRQFL